VQALSPLSRALFTEEMARTALRDAIDPQVWNSPWNVHSRANPNGHPSLTSLAPSVVKVAIATSRIGSLQGRTVTFTYRKSRSSRLRTTRLDAIEYLRRFLPHVLPHGCMPVRHVGLRHANGAIPSDTLRLLIVKPHAGDVKALHVADPAPLVASCPSCGKPMPLVMRLWNSNRTFVDTGGTAMPWTRRSRFDTGHQPRRSPCALSTPSGRKAPCMTGLQPAPEGSKASIASRRDGNMGRHPQGRPAPRTLSLEAIPSQD
jgi:hypothetical protein